ncbi:MAG TPA: AarF/UbiB family protein [Xanthomonadaceae bacterium]|nr:AarF/UbiB family protein [Xanthomonadaceae bacterium]
MTEPTSPASASPTPAAPTAGATGIARTAQILKFLLKYRSAGVFTGIDLDAAPVVDAPGTLATEGKPEEFVADLEALGPTFIKIGQAMSTRPDMVPPAYLAALERMQDKVEAEPFERIRDVVEAEFGMKIGKVFATFEEKPLGGASLAQVHAATLRDGREVAVKVQRPDVVAQINADLDVLTSLAARADRMTDLGRRIRFTDWVHEFRKSLTHELDYVSEAENLERFADHFKEYPELYVPAPVWDLCKPRVLTMARVKGVKVTDLSGVARIERDLDALASALMRGYLDQVFVHGEIHADPHAGNLLLTDDGRLAIFDLGMVAHVPPKQRDRLLKLLFAAVDGRGEEVANESIQLGTRLEDFDEERYTREVSQLVGRYAAHSGSRSLSEGLLVLELTRLGTQCGLRTPAEMSLLGKTLLNLESICNALDPELDVKTVVEGHLEHVMRARALKSLSPAKIASELMELQALMREAPRKVTDLLSLLAENRMQVRVTGLEESRLVENLQKIANRIAAGIITAALILASALLMRVETGTKLFGYPAVAMVLFLVAFALGLGIVISALLRDRKAKPHEDRGPR